ncbi:hypothetical protein MNBD_GAMMA21-873 [hydrothermal vent metagenome]|uniref:Uncharacterized protein n=1 Tax=hydrothermal vent metagenome TaxID=652676 RepID=A0A3B0ZQ77_9ZZZZ
MTIIPLDIKLSRNDRISLTGLIVISIVLLLTTANYNIEPLLSFQKSEIYKQLTGYLLFYFIGYQWYFALSRRKPVSSAQNKLYIHKITGLLMPVLLFIHAMQSGYAYQTLIWGMFITHCIVGVLNPDLLRFKRRSLRFYWFILHIILSIMVSGLLFYHLYVVYYYT